MLSRRSFLQSPAAALAVAPGQTTTEGHGKSPFLIGRWMVRSDELHFKDAKTAFIRAMQHESPQLKFPAGVPDRGDPVRVNIGWDVCYARGSGKHRSLGKLVLRVKPISDLRQDSELHIVETDVGRLDAEEFRPLMPTSLFATNRECFQRDWWIVRLTREYTPLLQQALERERLARELETKAETETGRQPKGGGL